jgi:hypothetical protein
VFEYVERLNIPQADTFDVYAENSLLALTFTLLEFGLFYVISVWQLNLSVGIYRAQVSRALGSCKWFRDPT